MMSIRRLHLLTGGLAAAAIALALHGWGSSSSSPTTVTTAAASSRAPGTAKPAVTLGTKNFTEELILGQLYAQDLRAKRFSVKLKSNIGDSEKVDRTLASGAIDGYPEYTGTILAVLAHDSRRPPNASVAYVRAAARERTRGDVLLAMAPATDTDTLIVKPAYASTHRLSSLADLAKLGSTATLAGPPEFRTRFDGLVGLAQVYGVHSLRFLPVKIGEQYRELQNGTAQIAVAFTTDG